MPSLLDATVILQLLLLLLPLLSLAYRIRSLYYYYYYYYYYERNIMIVCLGSVVVRALELSTTARAFEWLYRHFVSLKNLNLI